MAQCDADGVNGSNRISLMALRSADDAEWMSGKFRNRLALVLTDGSSWMSDRRILLPVFGAGCAVVDKVSSHRPTSGSVSEASSAQGHSVGPRSKPDADVPV
jgi:hypothetical protein